MIHISSVNLLSGDTITNTVTNIGESTSSKEILYQGVVENYTSPNLNSLTHFTHFPRSENSYEKKNKLIDMFLQYPTIRLGGFK